MTSSAKHIQVFDAPTVKSKSQDKLTSHSSGKQKSLLVDLTVPPFSTKPNSQRRSAPVEKIVEEIDKYPLISDSYSDVEGAPFFTSPSNELKDDTKRGFVEDVLAIVSGAELNKLFRLANEIKNREPSKPQWRERNSLYPDRKFNPVSWIKEHYGSKDTDDKWSSDGLTMADISRADRKLYDAYVALTRRTKDDPLHLPKTPKPRITDAEQNVEMRRSKRREAYHLSKK